MRRSYVLGRHARQAIRVQEASASVMSLSGLVQGGVAGYPQNDGSDVPIHGFATTREGLGDWPQRSSRALMHVIEG